MIECGAVKAAAASREQSLKDPSGAPLGVRPSNGPDLPLSSAS